MCRNIQNMMEHPLPHNSYFSYVFFLQKPARKSVISSCSSFYITGYAGSRSSKMGSKKISNLLKESSRLVLNKVKEATGIRRIRGERRAGRIQTLGRRKGDSSGCKMKHWPKIYSFLLRRCEGAMGGGKVFFGFYFIFPNGFSAFCPSLLPGFSSDLFVRFRLSSWG